jgi:hypothetical protein
MAPMCHQTTIIIEDEEECEDENPVGQLFS